MEAKEDLAKQIIIEARTPWLQPYCTWQQPAVGQDLVIIPTELQKAIRVRGLVVMAVKDCRCFGIKMKEGEANLL